MEKDPVCGMEVADTSTAESYEYEGKTYYFCTNLCKIQFEHEPEKFISKGDKDDHSNQDNSKHHH